MEHTTTESLATELLKELKASAKRWFIIAIVELIVIVGMLAGFFWYISLPMDEQFIDIANTEGVTTYAGRDMLDTVITTGE